MMACSKVKTSLSKLVKSLGVKIEKRSGAKLNFASEATVPVEEWIPEIEMARTKAINLRTAAQTQELGGITKLQQFNPSFFLVEENEIFCRVPGCSTTTPRLKASSESNPIKQDLFLCEVHRTKLADLVSKRCEEEDVFVNVASPNNDDFNGYTSLIGVLEKAFMHLIKKPATLSVPQNRHHPNSNLVLAEVFLNARNFLTITHALLNPNLENIRVYLPGFLALFNCIMDSLNKPRIILNRLVTAFHEVIASACNFFGIIYAWVTLGSPGEQFGGGVGLVIGAILGGFAAPLLIPVGAALGFIGGKLIGGGAYAWYRERQVTERQNQRVREYQEFMRAQFGVGVPSQPLFHAPGNAEGNLVLDVHYRTPAEL